MQIIMIIINMSTKGGIEFANENHYCFQQTSLPSNATGNHMELIRDHLDHAVIGVLGFMSFVLIWLVIERWLFYRRLDLSGFAQPEDLQIAVTRNLTTISSIGVNAPYIGLLGTVFGIMVTFYDMGNSGDINTQTIMVGLALALKATALGLLVAIPAIGLYNALQRRAEELQLQWRAGSHAQ